MDQVASSRLVPRSVLRFFLCSPFVAAALGAALVLCARPGLARADDDDERRGGHGDEWGRGDDWGRGDGEYRDHDDDDEDGAVRVRYREQYEAPAYGPSLDEFRDSLSSYGEWIDTPEYGAVWRPAVDDGWRPYYRGRWAWTVAGWYWVADEPFGWAVYHYGRWAYLDGIGWSWLPGRRWAPAWVAWRWGDGYAGWCPLGPRGYVYTRPVDYVIVQQQYFLAPAEHHAVPIVAAASFFPLTRAMPVLSPGPQGGPVVQAVAHAAGREVRPLNIVDVGAPRGPGGAISGGAVLAYRPRAAPAGRPQPEPSAGDRVSAGWSAGARPAIPAARPQWSGEGRAQASQQWNNGAHGRLPQADAPSSPQRAGVPPRDGWSSRPPVIQPSVGPHAGPPPAQPWPAARREPEQRPAQVRPYLGGVPQAAPVGTVHSAPRAAPAAAPVARQGAARQATQER